MIVTRREWRQVAWRNGRGTSQEILVRPGLVLNRTPLIADAPFSPYGGFDRLLVVIVGGLTLEVTGEARALAAGDLTSFPGEADVCVHVEPGQKVDVLNLITDRSTWRAAGEICDEGCHPVIGEAELIIVHASGEIGVSGCGGGRLADGDTLVVSDEGIELDVRLGRAVVLRLQRADASG